MRTQFSRTRLAIAILSLSSLSACVSEGPAGPSMPVAPGDGKTLGQFSQDDATCRQFAESRTGISPGAAANQSAVGSAVAGTLIGGAVGAVIGLAAGNPALGAAIGGGAGLLGGTSVGMDNAYASGANVQQRYDIAYQQCMTTTGNKTVLAQSAPPAYPGPAYPAPAYPAPAYGYPPPPPVYYYPPPPAYYYPPPPPVYYYPPPYYAGPCCWGPGFGFGATFIFGGGGHHWHHH